MNENDIIAKYVQTKYPELLKSADYAFFKIGVRLGEFANAAVEAMKGIDFESLKKMADEMEGRKNGEINSEK